MAAIAKKHTVELTAYEYYVLMQNSLIAMGCGRQLASATEHDERIDLSLTLAEIEDLTGFVAAEANHVRSKRQSRDLNEICDYLEALINSIKREDG